MGAHLRLVGKNHQLQVTMRQPDRKEFSHEEAEVAERPQEVSQKETKQTKDRATQYSFAHSTALITPISGYHQELSFEAASGH